MVQRSLQLIYWGLAIFIAATMLAPDLLGKLFLGVSLFGAAMALALQGMMKEVISGALLQLMPKFEVGNYIEVVGIADAKGKVVDIEYLSTKVETPTGPVIIPNSKIWENPVKLVPPPVPPAPPKVSADSSRRSSIQRLIPLSLAPIHNGFRSQTTSLCAWPILGGRTRV